MPGPFDYFIVLAEMRTGSNFLESNLNALESVECHGELFNPHFIGYPNKNEMLGFTSDGRDKAPEKVIDAVRNAPGELNGFRYFHSHDPRVLDIALDDPRCAKIILNRNPLDSYLSWQIARETQQWKLMNVKQRREAQISFDPAAFTEYLSQQQDFQLGLINRLQKSGQTPFYINYDDLGDLEVINGLATWLGVSARLEAIEQKLKPQNPTPALSKVTNPAQMEAALANLDRFNLSRTPNFEPRRAPAVNHYVAAPRSALIYMPVRGGPEAQIQEWLAHLDGTNIDALITNRNRKQMRTWLQDHPTHRKFTVLRHPLARAHRVFCDRIVNDGPGAYIHIRKNLRNRFKLPLPAKGPDEGYSKDQHRAAFAGFLSFLRQNLAGQTPIRVDGFWSSQARILEGFAPFAMPDLILREDEIATALPELARKLGHAKPPRPGIDRPDTPFALADIYDADVEALSRAAYQRDYLMFGFCDWTPITDGQ